MDVSGWGGGLMGEDAAALMTLISIHHRPVFKPSEAARLHAVTMEAESVQEAAPRSAGGRPQLQKPSTVLASLAKRLT